MGIVRLLLRGGGAVPGRSVKMAQLPHSVAHTHQVLAERKDTLLCVPGRLTLLLVVERTDDLRGGFHDVHAFLRLVTQQVLEGVVTTLESGVELRDRVLQAAEPQTSGR